ncbi:MAG: RNA-protein complex protein Nop10 [Candidatus Thermoplasmatota archaeon]
MEKIKKCLSCDEYMLKEFCGKCGEKTVNPKPPKYSPEDRFGEYRRRQKECSK